MPPLQTQQKAGKAKNRPNAGQFVNKEFSLSGPLFSLLMRSSIIASVASINPFTPFMFTRGWRGCFLCSFTFHADWLSRTEGRRNN